MIAVLAGILGFGLSYLFPTQYVASTRLLVRAHDTTYLNNDGETLGSQNGIFDSQLTSALSETQSALLSSNQIAKTVVTQLKLDEKEPGDHSIVGSIKNGLKSVIKHTTAWVVHGTYKNTDRFTQAVDDVQSGLASHQVDSSYVLQLDASANTPEKAVAIANAAANELVKIGQQRFAKDAADHKNHLTSELKSAGTDQRLASTRLGAFLVANGVSPAVAQSSLNPETKSQLQTDLAQTDVDLSAARAQQAALAASLSETQRTSQSSSSVQTGRSTTNLNESGPSNAFQQLLIQKAQVDGDVASLQAKQQRLAAALTPGGDLTGLSADKQQELAALEADYTTAAATYTQLNHEFQQALVTGANDPVELTRIDRPATPTYPSSPKRYLYLAMGIVTGAVLGLMLSALVAWRKGTSLFPEPTDTNAEQEQEPDEVINLVDPATRSRRRTPTPTPVGQPLGQVVTDLTGDGAVQRSRIGRFEVFENAADDNPTHDIAGEG